MRRAAEETTQTVETPLVGAGGVIGASSGAVPEVGGSTIGYTSKRRHGDRLAVVEEVVPEVGGPAGGAVEGAVEAEGVSEEAISAETTRILGEVFGDDEGGLGEAEASVAGEEEVRRAMGNYGVLASGAVGTEEIQGVRGEAEEATDSVFVKVPTAGYVFVKD
ncbi:hypothetical protein QJS10_CPB15g00852 [Acorus calamus]|uniref:Uncharacterized protein n=1 Tax=Acorus calamus TaxID=4465 RepID=A0AAV9D445_ACOCL|nr:hypothetical protein QJS10_CPB15g00852 [Acorus calamus]